MANMSSLSRDMADEILSRVPWTSLRRIRSTCKKWNTLSKDGFFAKKHLAQAAALAEREGEFLAVMLINRKLHLTSVNLHGTHNDSPPTVWIEGSLISLNDSDKLDITRVLPCDGLLLCVTEDNTRLVLWNPYSGDTRWICVERSAHQGTWYHHALGFDKSTHKILRFYSNFDTKFDTRLHEMYHVNSGSWRVLDVTRDWDVTGEATGLSLKGNTYWYAHDKASPESQIKPHFLLCFDFTAERFAPRIPLPFESTYWHDHVSLSTVKEEQLAALFHNGDTREMEIWVTTKIDPSGASWIKFLAVDMDPLTGELFSLGGSFLVIDEEKRAVVVVDMCKTFRNTAYFVGEIGYFREIDLGEIKPDRRVYPQVFSYVPSPVQIGQPS